MSQAELDKLFTDSPAGDIPNGEADGTAIVAPGTKYSHGDRDAWSITLRGREKISTPPEEYCGTGSFAFGLNAIVAKIYKGTSWFDNKECIVLDYSETSLVAHWIRDEIRQIGPGMYLGKVYWDKTRLIDFALQF